MSKELARLMAKEGISQSGLSRATGVPQPTINRILSQVTQDPRRDSMAALANYFGVPIDSLYANGVPNKTSDKKINSVEEIYSKILGLSKTERSKLFSKVADRFNQ
ncbi:MAG: helix-turn-helix domain-containing protein [Porticoccaceae bacterium]